MSEIGRYQILNEEEARVIDTKTGSVYDDLGTLILKVERNR
jgi:hypothetical protein